jgi:zinc protease
MKQMAMHQNSASNRTLRRGLAWLSLIVASGGACTPAATTSMPPETPIAVAASPQAAAENEDDLYATAPPEQREPPPAAGPSPEWRFPNIVDQTLPNGLTVKLVPRSTLPLVELAVLIRAGQASDGPKPGVAVLAGEMLKVGGTGQLTSKELLERVEALGSSLEITTTRDTTRISLAVTANQLDEALKLLSSVVLTPQFNPTEFTKLKRREMDRVESAARSDADWATNMVLYKQLFGASGNHPYSHYDATTQDVDKITLTEARKWYSQYVVPQNAALIVAGDVSPEVLSKAAQQYFGKWRGVAPKPLAFPELKTLNGLQIYLVDRPKSPQAELVLASLGPERKSQHFAPLKVANQILGGGVAGRLFLDVREQRSLAYSTYSSVDEVMVGPEPLLLRAGTQTAKAGLTLQALIEHAAKIGAEPVSDGELQTARRFITDVFLLRTETVNALNYMAGSLWVHGLPNDYFDAYRTQVRATVAPELQSVANQYFAPTRSIAVVTGDAERLASPLSHFGEVIIVDPDKNFEQRAVVPHNPSAPVELDRVDGT